MGHFTSGVHAPVVEVDDAVAVCVRREVPTMRIPTKQRKQHQSTYEYTCVLVLHFVVQVCLPPHSSHVPSLSPALISSRSNSIDRRLSIVRHKSVVTAMGTRQRNVIRKQGCQAARSSTQQLMQETAEPEWYYTFRWMSRLPKLPIRSNHTFAVWRFYLR